MVTRREPGVKWDNNDAGYTHVQSSPSKLGLDAGLKTLLCKNTVAEFRDVET
jgi:hypothetical protein